MLSSIVNAKSFRERGQPFGRLDAEFVDPIITSVENGLRSQYDALPLGELVLLPIESYVREKGNDTETKLNVAIDDIEQEDGLVLHQVVPLGDLPSRGKHILRSYDIVVSNVRPERGAVGMVLPVQDGAVGSSGMTIIRLADEIERNLVFAYLRSSIARQQLVRRSRGSMYPAVTKDDIPDILFPSFSKDLVNKVVGHVRSSQDCKVEFLQNKMRQKEIVEDYLLSKLGNPPPDIVGDTSKTISFRLAAYTEMFANGAGRLDAEFHRLEYVQFQSRLSQMENVIRLGEYYEAFSGSNPAKGSDNVRRLRQAQLSDFGIAYGGCELVEQARGDGRTSIRENDVVIGCTAHEPQYVGNRVDIVDDLDIDSTKIIPVPDVMIIRKNNQVGGPFPLFLSYFLKTKWGKRQFQRLNRGVRGGHVYGTDVENFIYVPVPSSEWMKEFTEREADIRRGRRESIAQLAAAVSLIESEFHSAGFPLTD